MREAQGNSTLGTAPDTYLYSLARNGNFFATIGSDDSLRLFDGSLKFLNKPSPAHTGISCLSTYENGFITAGRDGLVRCWDARATRTGIELSEPRGRGFSSLACHDHLIAVGTESTKEGLGDVSVLLYDTRNPSAPIRDYAESHTDSITQLAFHPSQPNILLSGSTDGLVSLFDANIQEEEDALQQVLNSRAAVHCSGFLSPTEVYIVTTDEHFSIHSISDTATADNPAVLDIGDVREKLQCMYVVDLLAGQQPVISCGHNVNRTLSIVQLDQSRSWSFGSTIDLPGAHGEEVVRDVMVLEQERKAIGCGEDGHVKVWDV
ncbi:hypothetical protein LTR37_010312 [Vermiconidia calcicola]|uniref:Uncharacterized protein n=1 Tax=Vermiconidia calcicola TaxID=1690605 RepID=A0ACC3N5S9_9PEZI|nr:hypothetical protein LTR37_010312 [Vermiconidia calcicola]